MQNQVHDSVQERTEFISDEETEVYLKAADILILPYMKVCQSGVLFLGYSFGFPAVATDVGSLREEIVERETGFLPKPKHASHLVRAISRYFTSDLYHDLNSRRTVIQRYASNKYSWTKVGAEISRVYARLLESRIDKAAPLS